MICIIIILLNSNLFGLGLNDHLLNLYSDISTAETEDEVSELMRRATHRVREFEYDKNNEIEGSIHSIFTLESLYDDYFYDAPPYQMGWLDELAASVIFYYDKRPMDTVEKFQMAQISWKALIKNYVCTHEMMD
jgi:hypothetical protein